MTEEFVEFFKEIRKGDAKQEITGEMGDLLAWILCLANILDIKVSDAINDTFKKEINRQLCKYSELKYCNGLNGLVLNNDISQAKE